MLAGLSALALCLVLGASTASPEGRIVVHGAASGTHLRLSLEGDRLLVHGWMAGAEPTGCKFTRYRRAAVCPLRSAGSIEVDTGSAPDEVQVLDKLPVPLVARLGAGSDRFVGSGERDTCYPEGSRRNRCIGGGGNDICITGNENSDCVGDAGDDYCQTGAGSDGCWGGPGDDVCHMGPGQDGCHGEEGDDQLYGGDGADQLYGGKSYDHCDGLPGWGQSHGCETGPRR